MPEFVSPPEDTGAAISAYRNALLRNAPRPELAHLAASLDPDVVAWLELMREGQRVMAPDPGFVARLATHLEAAPEPAADPQPAPPQARRVRRSHAVAMPRPGAPAARPVQQPGPLRRAAPYLATVALVLLLVAGGLFLLGPFRQRPAEERLSVPDAAIQLTPLWDTTGNNGIKNGYGVGVDPQGTIWVADADDRFHLIGPDGVEREIWGTPGSGDGQFDFLAHNGSVVRDYGDVAFDADGNIYVADSGNMRIQKFAPDRTFLLAWGDRGRENGQFLSPSSIAISPDGEVYVGDDGRGDVQVFDREGRHLRTIGSPGTREGQFLASAGIGIAPNGDLYVADYSNQRVQYFTPEGEFLGTWGDPGTAPGEFHKPNDVAIDAQGRVFVVEDFSHRLQVFTPDGRFLTMAGSYGRELGQLDDPLALEVGADGVVYVSDRNGLQAFRVEPAGS